MLYNIIFIHNLRGKRGLYRSRLFSTIEWKEIWRYLDGLKIKISQKKFLSILLKGNPRRRKNSLWNIDDE